MYDENGLENKMVVMSEKSKECVKELETVVVLDYQLEMQMAGLWVERKVDMSVQMMVDMSVGKMVVMLDDAWVGVTVAAKVGS